MDQHNLLSHSLQNIVYIHLQQCKWIVIIVIHSHSKHTHSSSHHTILYWTAGNIDTFYNIGTIHIQTGAIKDRDTGLTPPQYIHHHKVDGRVDTAC